MPKHGVILTEAAKTIAARRADYGEPADNFKRAAAIASNVLNVAISPYVISVVMYSMKLARMAESPQNPDHYRDGVSYLAFAGEFVNGSGPNTNAELAEIIDGSRGTSTTDPVS